MGSKKAEIVLEAIHCFLSEMNQIIETAKILRNDIEKYQNLIQENVGEEALPSEAIQHKLIRCTANEVENDDKKSPSMAGRLTPMISDANSSFYLKNEVQEINTLMNLDTDLQELLPAAKVKEEDIEEIAASMLGSEKRLKDRKESASFKHRRGSVKNSVQNLTIPLKGAKPNPELSLAAMTRIKIMAKNWKKNHTVASTSEDDAALKRDDSDSIRSDQGLLSPKIKVPLKPAFGGAEESESTNPASAVPLVPLLRMKTFARTWKKRRAEANPDAAVNDADKPRLKSFLEQKVLDEELSKLTCEESVEDNQLKPTNVISCESHGVWLWEFFVFLTVIYTAATVPFEIAMSSVKTKIPAFCVISPMLDLVYVIDIVLKTRMTYHNDAREQIWDLKKIQSHYLLSPRFALDLIAALPWASLVTWAFFFRSYFGLLAYFRLVKANFERYWTKVKDLLLKSTRINPAILRMLGILLSFFMLTHLYACLFIYNMQKGNFRGNWDLSTGRLFVYETDTCSGRYSEALYFSLAMIAGNHLDPKYSNEYDFASLGLLLAFIVNAVIIGSATSVLSNLDTTAVAKKEQLDAVSEYLRYKKIPMKMLNKILSYFSYLWETGQSSHTERLFFDLPEKLKLELTVMLNKSLIQNVPIFKACSPAGVIMMIKRLKPLIILPSEIIIKEGERADSMFFVNRGIVKCITIGENQETVFLATLREGSFFGEVALLSDNTKRTASIISVSFCELQVLMCSDFKAILKAFPDFQKAVGKIAGSRTRLSDNLRKVQSRRISVERKNEERVNDAKIRFKKIYHAKMVIQSKVNDKENSCETIPEEEKDPNDLYKAILQNQRQITRGVVQDRMQKKEIDESDFIEFEKSVNSEYNSQITASQRKKATAAAVFLGMHGQQKQCKKENTTMADRPRAPKSLKNAVQSLSNESKSQTKQQKKCSSSADLNTKIVNKQLARVKGFSAKDIISQQEVKDDLRLESSTDRVDKGGETRFQSVTFSPQKIQRIRSESTSSVDDVELEIQEMLKKM